jgi:hypothetical protein
MPRSNRLVAGEWPGTTPGIGRTTAAIAGHKESTMKIKALTSTAILGMIASLFVACGDGDNATICDAGRITCLDESGGEVCSDDGTAILSFSCGAGQVCGENEDGASACVGACEPAAKECVSGAVSRVCAEDGHSWVPVACATGTACDDASGECRPNAEEGVQICEPNERTCANDRTAKNCEADGTAWIYTACAQNEECDAGECVVIPEGVECTPNEAECVDSATLARCKASMDDPSVGDGWETLECPDGAPCFDGACRGPVCTVGEVRCDDIRQGNVFNALQNGTYDPRVVYRCNEDGSAWNVENCAADELCVYDGISAATVSAYVEELKTFVQNGTFSEIPVLKVPESSRASCQTQECPVPYTFRELLSYYEGSGGLESAGSFACGDPLDSESEFGDSYSLCEGLPPYNRLHWANYACTGTSTCSYTAQASIVDDSTIPGPECSTSCTPGAVSCLDREHTVTCDDEGNYDLTSVTKCVSDDDERELWCGQTLSGANGLDSGQCLEPACVVWREQLNTFALPPGTGACDGNGQFYQCLPDGTFAPAADCGQCVPNPLWTGLADSVFGGLPPGTCGEACVDGEQICVSDYDSPEGPFPPTGYATPAYYTCSNGQWELNTCPDGQLCASYTQQNPAEENFLERRIICGAECTPFTSVCGGAGGKQIADCSESGTLGDFANCAHGACAVDTGTGSSGSAFCEAECVEGEKTCLDSLTEATCTSRGRFNAGTACEGTEICAGFVIDPGAGSNLSRFGCAECLPVNQYGMPDMRCNGEEVEICGDDGTYAAGITETCTTCYQVSVGAGSSVVSCSPPVDQ